MIRSASRGYLLQACRGRQASPGFRASLASQLPRLPGFPGFLGFPGFRASRASQASQATLPWASRASQATLPWASWASWASRASQASSPIYTVPCPNRRSGDHARARRRLRLSACQHPGSPEKPREAWNRTRVALSRSPDQLASSKRQHSASAERAVLSKSGKSGRLCVLGSRKLAKVVQKSHKSGVKSA